MIFPFIVTFVIVSPVAGFIAAYQCLYSRMPCEGINNVHRVGVERVIVQTEENTVRWEEDIVELEENDIRPEENTVRSDKILMGFKEDDIGLEQDNIIIFFNNNVRIEQQDNNTIL